MQVLLSQGCIEVKAKHHFSQDDIEKKGLLSNDDIPVDDRNAGGLPCLLQISIGTRVMLIKNIYISKGLVNGALGYVESIEMHQEMTGEVNLIYGKFDDPHIGGILKRVEHNNAIAIEPFCQEFYYNGRYLLGSNFLSFKHGQLQSIKSKVHLYHKQPFQLVTMCLKMEWLMLP